ncbi:uncharacterized protein RSE6_01859 [Rhynchosporium secalis]|uniref:Fungal N-terminal domain-containing protein n=1 Tax=Rhynchosporium secalis TaxID=38038 RepID=A0A1E1LYW3_RHYSE|nr:uncharacterized protein RSE6_01859 [Rhynchosporium secalis]
MAEAFAIVGSVAAILQLSEFAFKQIYTAYGLHNSISGFTTTNEGVEKLTTKLDGLLWELQTQNISTSNPQDGQDAGLYSLVKDCASLGKNCWRNSLKRR